MKTLFYALSFSAIIFTSCATSNIQQPEYRDIREIRLVEVGLLKSKAGLDLVFYNPNKFGVALTEAKGDVYVDGHLLGKFELDQKVDVKKKADFVVPAIISVDMIGAIKNQREIWKKKEAEIRVEGSARVRKAGISKEIPISFTSVQNIEKFKSLLTF